MKTQRKLTMALTVLLAIAWISTAAWAKRPEPPAQVCGLTGAWVGDAENDLSWLGIHTSTDGIKGEMLMNWVRNTLSDNPPIELAPGHGVWELTDSDTGTYSFTWYSQAEYNDPDDPSRVATAPVRVSGTAQMQGCDEVKITYLFEIQIDVDGVPVWDTFDTGTTYETRLKVHTPDPQ